MAKNIAFLLFFICLLGFGGVLSAQTLDPIVGVWKSFDDETNRPAALIQINEKNGVLSGLITKILDTSGPSTCERCTDFRKGKPILGMEILSGLKKTGDGYSGGQILDPDDGEIYRVEMKLKDQGAKLDLRAYIGIPLLGRTQTWIREK